MSAAVRKAKRITLRLSWSTLAALAGDTLRGASTVETILLSHYREAVLEQMELL